MRIGLILFITIPLMEMLILIEVGGIIGALPTVALVVLTATIGIWLLRLEGMATLARVQAKLDQGQLPETELLEGIMLLVGGALLLTPGFVTDAMGFTCLIPIFRRPIARWIIRQGVLKAMNLKGTSFSAGSFSSGSFSADTSTTSSTTSSTTTRSDTPSRQRPGRLDDQTIEGEFREEKD